MTHTGLGTFLSLMGQIRNFRGMVLAASDSVPELGIVDNRHKCLPWHVGGDLGTVTKLVRS